MSGIKPITSYFKVLTADEREMEDLLRSQSCSLSRVLSSQSARTRSTLSTKVFDQFIDLTKDPVVEEDDEPVPPCLLACVDYSSDDDDVVVVDDEEEEPVGS